MKIRLTESGLIKLIKSIKEQIENDDYTDLVSKDLRKEDELNDAFNDLIDLLIDYGYEKSELFRADYEQLLMKLGDVIDDMEPSDERSELEMFYEELGQLLYGDMGDYYGSVEDTDFEVNEFLNEAEYKGRKVKLGKIMQGDVKKFKVFVKNDKGKVVKVNFGFGGKSAKGKRMVIKKNNPERRKSFRARHNCDNPGPRWKPRYWACRTW